MPNQTYTALTIGPIYQTITEAKRSRAKWAASYFFSWFVKRVLQEAKKEENSIKVLIPHTGDYETSYGSGLYADRLYFIGTVKDKINEIVKEVTTEIADDIKKNTEQPNVLDFLNQYLNIHILEINLSNYEFGKDEFALSVINQKLDQIDLHQNMPFEYEINPLQEYFLSRTEEGTILSIDAFPETKRYFPSLAEISTRTLKRLEVLKNLTNESPKYDEIVWQSFINKKDDIQIIEEFIKNQNYNLLPHHKYYAIMYADGDNIGKLLAALNRLDTNKELQEFSKQLFEFGVKTDETIYNYGGNGIFLGGEDILAFLPMACVDKAGETTKTIFQLITKIDENWKATVQKVAEDFNKEATDNNKISIPTLSYGIQIAYHKYPLKEAMSAAYQLMEKAKNKYPCKNTIGISFRKHSGQSMEAFIEKSKNCSYHEIQNFIAHKCRELQYDNTTENNTEKSTNERLLSGIMHRLKDSTFQILLQQSIKNQSLDAFFENSFNEKIHIENSNFMNEVKTLLHKIFNDYSGKHPFKIAYFTLRLTHFINAKTETDA